MVFDIFRLKNLFKKCNLIKLQEKISYHIKYHKKINKI